MTKAPTISARRPILLVHFSPRDARRFLPRSGSLFDRRNIGRFHLPSSSLPQKTDNKLRSTPARSVSCGALILSGPASPLFVRPLHIRVRVPYSRRALHSRVAPPGLRSSISPGTTRWLARVAVARAVGVRRPWESSLHLPSVRSSVRVLPPASLPQPACLPARPPARPPACLSLPLPPPSAVPPGPSTFFVYPSFFLLLLPPSSSASSSSFLLAGDYFPFPSRRPRRVTCEPPLLASHTDAPGIRVCVHASAASPRPAPFPRRGDATRSLGSASHRARRAAAFPRRDGELLVVNVELA